ncbi:CARD- and ANK-domain containing inflammasome adapter protein [Siniperca chuatsi]|uniref:CARD- and ANK-domain containing inflammasome adapter protein n=1 Tax=Siniperca chuatsi TaxID=119488 RepID=UPI001CE0FFFA|nr:CARD- and ANK-domain containing inflammasome adapter protein [Siniperca chuatsi]
MFNILKGFDAQAASNYINPYAVDVIRAKRRDLVYGISHTEDLLDLLVTEGVMTAAKRSIILTIRTRTDQNSRVLDILEARGERACRKFFHPCLMLAEPDLYRRIKTYVCGVNERIRDTRRQLIGYLLERDQEGMDKVTDRIVTQKTHTLFATKETKKSSPEKEDRSTVSKSEEHKPAQSKSDNFIHMIAADGELVLLEELLEDTDINIVNSSNETLLHIAAEFGHLSIIELLIREGARLDLQDIKGHTALHRAASKGHTEAVRALIQAEAPIYTQDLQGKTPVHLAAENEHLNSVKVLVKEENKRSESYMQDMFLHTATMEDNWRLAEMLLQSGARVDARNNHKQTALFYAVSRNNEKTVTVLLNAGAKVDCDVINEALKLNEESILRLLLDNVRALSEEALGSALFSAVKQNDDGVVTVLIDSGANVNMLDKQGYTPLLLSAELGHTEVFRVLVAKQAKLDATLSDLSSALHLAVHSGSVPIVQTLLERGLDPNITGPKAQTPLHLAAQCNRPEFVDLLLRAGAQVNAVAQDGLTPLHIASQQGHADPVIQILQGKADPGVKDRVGRTALHWAASSKGESCVVDLLLSAKANPNTTDNEKKTALHLAAEEGKVDAVTSLLSHKAKGGAKDMDGSTPLHYAAAGGHASVVSALLQLLNNKGIEERNAWRKTPLHAAAEKGHDSVAVLLLEAGAKINSTDHSKDTPLHCAARGGHQEVVKRLVNWGQAGHTGRQKKVNLQATNNVGKTPLQVAESGDTPEHENVATLLMRKMFLIK